MSYPSIIYKKFHMYKPVEDFAGIQWFALKENYGTEYGDISRSYRFKTEPKLLDVGDADVRVMIENEVRKKDPALVRFCNPDEQYSGTAGNTKYHNILKQLYGDEYDGTIIDEHHLKGNKQYPTEELEGASEIVIWKDFNELLEELPNEDMGKGINKLNKLTKKRKNRRRTNRRRTNRRRTNRRH